MLYMKGAGILCILAASLLTGAEMENRMKRRWYFFRELYELLAFLEKEMTYHRAPIQEAFQTAEGSCGPWLRAVLRRTQEEIGKNDGRAFDEIWREAVAACIPEKVLSEEEKRTVCETAAALCSADTVTQRTLLRKYEERFLAMSRKEEEDCREKGGLYRKLAAAAGVFLVILLL